jgi:hypothetical protein
MHSSLFSPALSTLEIPLAKSFITNSPGLTASNLRRHSPVSRPMDKGHLDRSRQNQRYTKPALIEADDGNFDIDEYHPEPANTKSHRCSAAGIKPAGQIYTDQTGRFVIPSSSGNNYLMVLYGRATSSSEGLLSCTATPTNKHTFQNHFIAGLCSMDKDFPTSSVDAFIDQAESTLNLLRSSRINPKLSAHAQVNGQFDYNRTPLGPPGCRVMAHVKPDCRALRAASAKIASRALSVNV